MACAEPATPSAGQQDTHHEDAEWEAQRENFTLYYMKQNKPLKAAMQLMTSNHNFPATHRQWERRIKDWRLQKYTSRQARIDEIQQQGRSIEDVAEPGRRSAAHLQPNDDRNLRRFARRELTRSPSRSRSRSRSQSFGKHSRSTTPIPHMPRKTSAPEPLRLKNIHGLSILAADQLTPYVTHEPTAMSEAPNPMDQSSHMLQGSQTMPAQTNDNGGVSDLFITVPSENQPSPVSPISNVFPNSSYSYPLPEGPMLSDTSPFPAIDMAVVDMRRLTDGPEDSMSTTSTSFVSAPNDRWDELEHYQGRAPHDYPARSDPLTEPRIENLSTSPRPESSNSSQPVQEFDGSPDFTFQPALSPNLGATNFESPPAPLPDRQSDDPNFYDDCYGSVSRHTQLMHDAVIRVCTRLGAPDDLLKPLQNELHYHRANLMSDLTMHLNSFASAKERAVQAMISNLNVLRSRMSQEVGADHSPTPGAGTTLDQSFRESFSLDPLSDLFSLPETNTRYIFDGAPTADWTSAAS
ncbi:hypothetical protein DV736_g3771, partial [Chaetothyriales sp. CBS 134916]